MPTAGEVFGKIGERLSANPDSTAGIDAVYQFSLEGGDNWFINLRGDTRSVTQDFDGSADCTITMTEENFLALTKGDLNPQMAFMTGKIKVAGDLSKAMKLQKVLG